MLDNAHTCLQMLASEATPSVPTVAPLDPSTFARTVQIPTAAMPGEFENTDVGLTPPTLAARPSVTLPEKADPELVNLFIEEAREELTKIQRHFPAWEQNPLEQDGLVTLRRSFHTLKGSGRMVGARDLSEFAWSVENLLNRLLDNTLTRSPQILAVLRDAVNALPQLIEQLETGRSPQVDTSGIVARAHALASTKPPRASGASDEERAPVAEKKILAAAPPAPSASVPAADGPKPEPPVVSSQLGSDDLLRDIYSRETGAHVATVRGYLERERTAPGPHTLTEDVYRACHTLSGSSKMAEARHGIRLAEPLDHWLRKSFNSGVGLDDTDLTLLSDCMAAMESVATHLDESTGYFLGHDGLRERIADSEAGLDARIAEAARLAAENAAASETRLAEALKLEAAPQEEAACEEDSQVEEMPGLGAVEFVPAEAITLESPEPV